MGDETPPMNLEKDSDKSTDERTETTRIPASENVGGETIDAPSKDISGEGDSDSKNTASGPDDNVVVSTESSGSGDASADPQTNGSHLETTEPTIDEKTSDCEDDRTDKENAAAQVTADGPVSPMEEKVNGHTNSEVDVEASPSNNDEASAEPKTESNDKATDNDGAGSDDGDDTIFLDARSSELSGSEDFKIDVEQNIETTNESKPAFDAKTEANATNDGDEGNNSNNDTSNLGSIQSDKLEDKASTVENNDKVNVETNTEDGSELNASTSAEATGDSRVDQALSVNSESPETNVAKKENLSAEPNDPTETLSEAEAKSDSKMEATDVGAQNTSGETGSDVEEDPGGEVDRTKMEAENIGDQDTNGEIGFDAEDDRTKMEGTNIGAENTNGKTGFDVEENPGGKGDKINDGVSEAGTYTTYMDDLPLFHYSRIVGSGLPKGIQEETEERAPVQLSACSEFAVVRVDREELVSTTSIAAPASPTRGELSRSASLDADNHSHASTSSAADMRNRQREQALLLSSDLWSQPHSIVATGYGGNEGGKITLTRLTDSSDYQSSNSSSSPAVVVATPSTDLGVGGIRETSGDGTGSNRKYSNVSTTLYVREEVSRVALPSIADMSFDASGSILGAVDEGGHCAVWEFKYTTSLQSTTLLFENPSSNNRNGTNNANTFRTPDSTPDSERPQVPTASATRPAQNTSMFSNFMSVLTGIPPPDENTGGGSASARTGTTNNDTISPARTAERGNPATDSNDSPTQPPTLVPALTAEILNLSRFNYPAKWGPPTCLAIDPAYKIKRDKAIAVGFANGQLYLTKKGTFFQRRVDTILYQAGNRSDSSYRGIETVTWRGPLVAFADASGIKLIDSIHLTRIAHIARPAGASPFLYPSIRDISPSLFFETAQHLLVAWGDCLMQIYVEENQEDVSPSAPTRTQSGGSSVASDEKRIKRSAACTMAWELDCVACDIVPLDRDHVIVLGLVSLADGVSNFENDEDNTASANHDLEMQIVSRKDGTISYSDSLPLIEERKISATNCVLSVRDYRLLSSFALPRMEQWEETKALRALKGGNEIGLVGIDVSFDMNQPLFAGTDSFLKKGIEFKDTHLEWNINSIMYDENNDYEAGAFRSTENDDSSVDSDDYECILRPIETIRPLPSKETTNVSQNALPPTMVICTGSEAVLSIPSTVDDAIQYSLDNHKCALALYRGIRHKQELRRFSLDDLINFYLEAVLRIPRSTNEPEDAKALSQSLSLRRTNLAIKAMPVLLGDKVELWERWTKELENIPGALFLLRKYLPVRGT